MLTPLLAVGAAVALFAALWMVGVLRSGVTDQACSTCREPYRTVHFEAQGEAGAAHDLLVCPEGHEAKRIQRGYFSRFISCPSCRQRTLLVTPRTRRGLDGTLLIGVEESCGLCGHRSQRQQELRDEAEGRRGLVIDFPDPDARAAWRQRRDRAAPDD